MGKVRTVAVIGAGISGLSAAHYLSKASHLKVMIVFTFAVFDRTHGQVTSGIRHVKLAQALCCVLSG